MGINGLLRNLHPLLVPPPSHHTNRNNNGQEIKIKHNIQQFAHKSLAIDASSWIFKSAYTCSERLVEAQERGVRDPYCEDKYCKYMVSRCRELLNSAKIATIYLVFDGIRVPLKAGTNADRENRRRVHLAEARRLSSMGRREEAKEQYNKCVKGTEEMARVVCAEVEKVWGRGAGARVKCVFSPYEADAQLAKLCVDGVCHAVVTEDSDVLVYSATCRRPFPIIYKLDRKDGSCDVLTMDWLLNPKFLPTSRRSDKWRKLARDDSDDDEPDHEDSNQNNSLDAQNSNIKETHSSEIDYGDDDNMMYAPIRRTLPPPLSNVPSSHSNSRARRSTYKESGTGAAILTTLRSFANKEAAQPGAGVRLFVQACVLSGCDYVPNRLSKVGPVTAFKLVKDASHRLPGERFDRVMKSLPKGSVLQKEPTDGKSNDEDATGDDENDFLSSCSSYSEMKEKYLELLSKSEAVFYYHLVKEQASSRVVPLVPHKPVESTSTDNSPGDSSPSIDNFDSDLSFIGSTEAALKNLPTAALPCPRNQPPATANQNNTGWITAKNTYKKQPSLPQTKSLGIQPPLKGTLQYSFNRHNNVKNSLTINRHTSASHSSRINTTNQLTQKSPLPTNATMPSTTAAIQSNSFSSFAHNSSKFERKTASRTTTGATLSLDPKTKPSPSLSPFPFLSPMGGISANFDYTEASTGKECKTKSLRSDADTNKLDEVRKDLLLDQNNDDLQIGNHTQTNVAAEADDISSGDDASLPQAETKTIVNVNDNTFEYDDEIIPESPPIETSKFFDFTSCRGSPRRVSTSPDTFYPYNQGSSPDNAINLADDLNSDSESAKNPSSKTLFGSQTSNRSKSSVNKRPFKSPYPNLTNQQTVVRKKPRPASSGALLAGFAIQRDRDPGKSLGGTKQRMAARTANNQSAKAKGNVSIQNFLKSSGS